jgi:periplasmic protein TonB
MLQLLVSFTWETPHMSINLIESKRVSQRSIGGTFVSIALHASLITLAVYATASAGEVGVKVPIDTVTVFYPPQPAERAHSSTASARANHPTTPVLPRESRLHVPTDIPDKLPPIDSSLGALPAESLFASRDVPGSGKGGAGAITGSDSGEPMFVSQVDKPAMARDGNPNPGYPALLESSRIEGRVVVQFVVDTLGRADMHSLKVLESSNELFVQSLESALSKWRFYPAEAGGRKVKQIVQLPLRFVAPPR